MVRKSQEKKKDISQEKMEILKKVRKIQQKKKKLEKVNNKNKAVFFFVFALSCCKPYKFFK